MGIHGQALYSSLREVETVLNTPWLYKALGYLGGPYLKSILFEYKDKLNSEFEDERLDLNKLRSGLLHDNEELKDYNRGDYLRRLSVVEAPGGKSRIIAIFDYWSQCAQRPQHLQVINRQDTWFPGTDMTMNQLSFFSRIPESSGKIFSFDLSSATDRFPIKYQEFCQSKVISPEYAFHWKETLTRLPFLVTGNKFKDEDRGRDVYYNAGQPMGGYSSWAVFAQCHHILVRACGFMVYKDYEFSKYFILGDDLVIFDERVALLYKRVITQLLGVEISLSKSIISENSFEFAKRIVIDKQDVSPIPWTQLLRVNNPQTVLAPFLSDWISRSVGGVVLSLNIVRKWISILPGVRKSSFSAIVPIFLQTILISKRLGFNIYVSSKDATKVGLKVNCLGLVDDSLLDLVSYFVFTKIPTLTKKLNDSFQEQYIVFSKTISHCGSLMGYHIIPHLALQERISTTIGSLKADISSTLNDQEQIFNLLLEADDAIDILQQSFNRRLDRKRELFAHASRKYQKYTKVYSACLLD